MGDRQVGYAQSGKSTRIICSRVPGAPNAVHLSVQKSADRILGYRLLLVTAAPHERDPREENHWLRAKQDPPTGRTFQGQKPGETAPGGYGEEEGRGRSGGGKEAHSKAEERTEGTNTRRET